jgi:hypothetical protein
MTFVVLVKDRLFIELAKSTLLYQTCARLLRLQVCQFFSATGHNAGLATIYTKGNRM